MGRAADGHEEHAFKRIQADLHNGTLGNLLFFYGREDHLVRWAVESVADRFVAPALRTLDFSRAEAAALSLEELAGHCETLPMGSEKRVLVVDGYPPVGTGSKGLAAGDEDRLLRYLEGLPDTLVLIFTAASVDRRRKFFKQIQAAGGCYEFDRLSEPLLRSFVDKRLRQQGRRISPAAFQHLVALSGYYDKESDYTLFHLENDLKKAAALSDGPEVSRDDLCAAISGNTEVYVFDMVDAMAAGDKGKAFRMLHDLLDAGENEYKLLALLCSQLETIVEAKELAAEGKSQDAIRAFLGIHEFRVRKALQHGEGRSLQRLRATLVTAFGIDRAIKNGQMEARLALELLIAEA